MPPRRYADDWDDDDRSLDDSIIGASFVDDDASRALARYDESQFVAIVDDGFVDDDDDDDAVFIIPGAGLAPRATFKRRKRPLTLQLVMGAVIACVIIGALFTVMPIDAATGDAVNPLSALANAVNLSNSETYFMYRALPGDTFDNIAVKFGIEQGGIFLLNGLRADQSCLVGALYKIPTNPKLGRGYNPPLPPGMSGAGYGLPSVNIIPLANAAGARCNFCAIAGMSNGEGGTCVSNYVNLNVTGNVSQYNLKIPNPKSRWGRGFSAFHSGDDISTGTYGTPILAAQDGQVIFADWDLGGGGWTVKINHCGGLATSYSHLIDVKKVKVGQPVKAGDIIGYQGNSGESFGTHLHFMTWWYNIPFDPVCAFPSGLDGVTLGSEGGAYGGCPPTLSHSSRWWSN